MQSQSGSRKQQSFREDAIKKLILLVTGTYSILTMTPTFGQTQGKHAVGDMYSKVPNALDSRGKLDSLEPKKIVTIKDMRIDPGQIFVTLT